MPIWLEILIPTITGVAGAGIGIMVGVFIGGVIAYYDMGVKKRKVSRIARYKR